MATAFKLTLLDLDVFQMLAWACIVSIVTLALVATLQGKLHMLLEINRSGWRRSLVAGLMNPFLYYLVLFAAYDRLPAQVAQPLNYTWAITLTLMSVVILKQRITTMDLTAGLICYSGVLIICTQGQFVLPAAEQINGILLALFSTVIWSAYWIYNIRDERDPVVGLLANFLCSLPFILLTCVLFSTLVPDRLNGLIGAAYIGVAEMGLAFVLWSIALKLAENTSRVSNLIFLSPFVSLWLINYFLNEPIHVTTWTGLVIIIAGLLLQRLSVENAVT